jgi:hypothetical protein
MRAAIAARGAIAISLAVGASLITGAGCSRKTEYAGLGPWHVKRTVLRDASGRCQPADLPDGRQGTWCFGQPGLRLGGQDASVDLYFGGIEPDARVIEIQLQFRGCNEAQLAAWVRQTFGAPFDEQGARGFWRNPGAYVIADLPGSAGRCTLRMMPRSEEAEVERLRAEAAERVKAKAAAEAGSATGSAGSSTGSAGSAAGSAGSAGSVSP